MKNTVLIACFVSIVSCAVIPPPLPIFDFCPGWSTTQAGYEGQKNTTGGSAAECADLCTNHSTQAHLDRADVRWRTCSYFAFKEAHNSSETSSCRIFDFGHPIDPFHQLHPAEGGHHFIGFSRRDPDDQYYQVASEFPEEACIMARGDVAFTTDFNKHGMYFPDGTTDEKNIPCADRNPKWRNNYSNTACVCKDTHVDPLTCAPLL